MAYQNRDYDSRRKKGRGTLGWCVDVFSDGGESVCSCWDSCNGCDPTEASVIVYPVALDAV